MLGGTPVRRDRSGSAADVGALTIYCLCLAESAEPSNGITGNAHTRLDESELLRDTVLILQGVDGRYFRFKDPEAARAAAVRKNRTTHPLEREDIDDIHSEEGGLVVTQTQDGVSNVRAASDHPGLMPAVHKQPWIPQSTTDLLIRLSEIGWLYRKIQRSIQDKLKHPDAGMIELVWRPEASTCSAGKLTCGGMNTAVSLPLSTKRIMRV